MCLSALDVAGHCRQADHYHPHHHDCRQAGDTRSARNARTCRGGRRRRSGRLTLLAHPLLCHRRAACQNQDDGQPGANSRSTHVHLLPNLMPFISFWRLRSGAVRGAEVCWALTLIPVNMRKRDERPPYIRHGHRTAWAISASLNREVIETAAIRGTSGRIAG